MLGESDTNTYQIILYQNKQKPLTNIKIACDFVITVSLCLRPFIMQIISLCKNHFFQSQPDNFCTFYDNLKQNWAVLFDSKEVAQKFCDEVHSQLNFIKLLLIIVLNHR